MRPGIDVGATLQEVFETYRDQAGVLLPIAFWIFLVVAIVSGLAGASFALFPLVIVVSTIAATLYQGVVVSLVRDIRDGRRDYSAGDLVSSAWPVVLPLIGAGILSGLGIGIGLFLLVVPGLILLTIWAVIAPVIVVERSGVIDAFGRSRELVRGNGWQVFGVILVAFLIAAAAGIVFSLIATSIANGPIVRIVFSAIASTLTAPITALAAAVLYYRLLALQAVAPPPPPPAAPPPAP
jgi:ABC-type multidrug transport system fused ATPase/permease subunit